MGLFDKFKIGLDKSSISLSTGFKNIFSKKKINENILREFEELIISSWNPALPPLELIF